MSSRHLLSAAALSITTAFIFSTAKAQAVASNRATATGILTDRLSAKQLERWHKIERIVFAVNTEGQILHSVLHALWKWVNASRHAIYIEIPEPQIQGSCTAGSFRLERFDPTGRRHIAVIRLNLNNIDNAYVGPETTRSDGLIPFEGLSREERYAEVLGHELAHAQEILLDPERTRLVEEYIEQTNDLIRFRPRARPIQYFLGAEMRRRIFTRDFLIERLERYANMVETLVWRELLVGQRAKKEQRQLSKKPFFSAKNSKTLNATLLYPDVDESASVR
jgi:hypothetical protein